VKALVIPNPRLYGIAAVLSATIVIGALGMPASAAAQPSPTADPDVYVTNGSTTASGATILNDGHIDIASLVEGGQLATKVKDTSIGSEAVWRETGRTVLQLLPESLTTVPADPAFAFLGDPGSPLWQVTQTQQDGLLWPGWSTEALPLSATSGGVSWTLGAVEGYPDDTGAPSTVGAFSLYESGTFGAPSVLLDSTDPARSTFVIPRNVHAHGAWSFTAEGVYCLSFGRTAQANDGTVMHDDFVLTMAVGNVPVRTIDPGRCFDRRPVVPPVPGDIPVPVPGDPTLPPVPVDPTVPAVPSVPTGPPVVAVPDNPALPGIVPPLTETPPVPPAADPEPAPASRSVAATQCVAGATILSSGHVDYASRIVNGKLESLIKDGTTQTAAWREPSGTVVWLKPSARVTLPVNYGAIGPAGSAVWQVPQTQNTDLVWLGWNSEELSAATTASPVSWTLNSVSGPGSLKVFLQGSFGEVKSVVFDNGGTHAIALGKHVHGNWAFSAEGVYRLSFTQSVTLAGGATSSDTETLTIAVGNVDPASAIAGAGAGCGAIGSAALGSSAAPAVDAAALAAVAAAAQAQAAAAAPTERERPSKPSARSVTPTAANATATVPGTESVQLLLLVLGGLLLVGAVGGGALWLRHTRSGTAAPAGE
jgi:putative ABC transporter-associated repeat protein